MQISDLYKISVSLSAEERESWFFLFQDSLKPGADKPDREAFEHFLAVLYVGIEEKQSPVSSPAIAYGAGNVAKEFLPRVMCCVEIAEIWDAYTETAALYDIPVVKPHFDAGHDRPNVIVFIENHVTENEIERLLRSEGYENIYSYREFLLIAEATAGFSCLNERVTEKTEQLLYEFIDQYEVIDNQYPPVNYSVLPKKLASQQIAFDAGRLKAQEFLETLCELLIFTEEDRRGAAGALSKFNSRAYDDVYTLAYQIEIFLRNLLANGIKTKERPIRMLSDSPYDQFAVYTALREVLRYVAPETSQTLAIIETLRTLSVDSVPLMSAECCYLVQSCRFLEALDLSRKCVKKEPNGLLSNETFYRVAMQCKDRGIPVPEPLPDYDLSARFCWSGLTFALCSGFNPKDGSAEFLPCFRTLQCAAYPKGEFWSGDEWTEFRKSILDGSFKYCQKNQCSNIAAGWLPKKTDCQNPAIRKMMEGDFSVVPPLEELHFSYDFHCNLKCPSCRLDIKSNSAEQNAELDLLFENNLRPLLKNAKHLCLSGCGEAVISPHSKRVLQSLSGEEYPELAVELRTNAFSFNRTTWNALGTGREVIRHVAASIDSASKELFEQLRRPAKWDVTVKNLALIQSLRNAGEIDLFEFHTVVQPENIGELIDIIKMAIAFDADVITFSRLVNWRGMSEEEYQHVNPFWEDHPRHGELMQVIEDITKLRNDIEAGECELTRGRKRLLINMHCVPDPGQTYDDIRIGTLKVR